MTLLGQHGQKQDYELGSRLIRLAAETADENAPQGAYVSSWPKLGVMLIHSTLTRGAIGLRNATRSRATWNRYPREVSTL